MGRLLSISLAVAMAAFAPAQVISVYFDGERDEGRFPPVLRNGRTMLFLRDTFDRLGAAVHWNAQEKMILAWQGETEIQIWVGQTRALLNGQEITLDQPPIIEDFPGRGSATLIPLRFISEALGAGVKYDGKQNRVDIAKSDMPIWNEAPVFKVGDVVEILSPVKAEWVKGKVLKVFDNKGAIDKYEVEYLELDSSNRRWKGTMARSHLRKPRS
jgi:hypothetical protein